MPFDYRRDDAHRRIIVTAHQSLTVEEYAGVVDRQAADGTWRFGLLWDLRAAVAPLPVDEADLVAAHVYRNLIRHGTRGPVAVVTGSSPILMSAMAYASKTVRAGLQLRAFSGLVEAEEWLTGELLNDAPAR